MNNLAAIETILRETRRPMTVRQLVERSRGRLPTRAKFPDTVLARDLSVDIKKKGAESLFVRVKPGLYTLRDLLDEPTAASLEPAVSAAVRSRPSRSRARSPERARQAMLS